jgi:hypothetical protein
MLLVFKHISIGPLVVWPNWMPLSECDHHWTCSNVLECTLSAHECSEQVLNQLEHGWTCSECSLTLWVTIEHGWTWLNIWVCMNTFEWALNALEMHLSAPECLWVSLNVTECTQLLISIWKWVCMNACKCVWLWLNTLERTLSVREGLWVSIECTWMRLNALWVRMNAFERVLNVTESAWMHSECVGMSLS